LLLANLGSTGVPLAGRTDCGRITANTNLNAAAANLLSAHFQSFIEDAKDPLSALCRYLALGWRYRLER
jgi:hypothetical protein